MKSRLTMAILFMGCTPPAPSPEPYLPLKVDSQDYWEPTLKSFPSGFKFPSDSAASENVVIEVDTQIDKKGHPTGAKATARSSVFASSAEDFVMACEFQPAKLDKVPVDCTFRIRVIFNTHKQEINLRNNNGKPFRRPDSK